MIDNKKLSELVIRVQGGDKDSFGDIYDILLEPIYTFIFYKVSHKELAEDLTEEVFVKVWDNIIKYKAEENIPFSSWVYRIAGNLVIDFYRKHKKEVFLDPEFDIADENAQKFVKEDAENSINQQLLVKGLGKLPQSQRDVIIFKYVNDMAYSEISVILDKPEGTVRQLHARALVGLKEHLAKFF